MTLPARIFYFCSIALALAFHGAAVAAPVTESVGERPQGEAPKRVPPKAATYGMCDAPQNADNFPSNPVPLVAGKCENSQTFTATSAGPSTGGQCGGFTVAFGPLGDLKPQLDRVHLKAEFGETLTAAQCASAKVAAVGWGAKCTNDSCTTAAWEKIGGPTQKSGTWHSTSQKCFLEIRFYRHKIKHKTLNLDVIATVVENGKAVRKRAKGTIYVERGNGKCFSATQKAS